MKQNITLAMEKETLRKARILAVERGTSVSQLLADELARVVTEHDAYEDAEREALAEMERGFDLGSNGKLPPREELYDI